MYKHVMYIMHKQDHFLNFNYFDDVIFTITIAKRKHIIMVC